MISNTGFAANTGMRIVTQDSDSIDLKDRVRIAVVRLPHSEGIELPGYQTAGSSGADLRAACPEDTPIELLPGERKLISTGLVIELPDGVEAQIRPRSGLAYKYGITCLNTPGTIDWDYRGEIMVLLINLGSEPFEVTRGMRIAQMVFAPVLQASLFEQKLSAQTERGSGGFGSTGL